MSALNRMTSVQKTELEQALNAIKNGDYAGTAVKVELEAELGRDIETERETCETCDGEERVRCHLDCDDGYNCPNDLCDDGSQRCIDCHGMGFHHYATGEWGDAECREFMLNNVPTSAREALIYGKFYDDRSVDSEFTFTLPIDKAQYVVHYIEAFKKLAETITGGRMDVDGAGMHIAILNEPKGFYPAGNKLDPEKAENFKKAVMPLFPAMYFLASCDHRSRQLQYRQPGVGNRERLQEYPAINTDGGCYEFRLFETCYDKPLAFIDFMIVISRLLRYYKDTATDTSMKIGELGIKDGYGIDRFYYSVKHYEALERGVELIRPRYKSFDELKQERSLNICREELQRKEEERESRWREEFQQVKRRRRFERLRLYHAHLSEAYGAIRDGYADFTDAEAHARERLQGYIDNPDMELRGDFRQYLQRQQHIFMTENVRYRIEV